MPIVPLTGSTYIWGPNVTGYTAATGGTEPTVLIDGSDSTYVRRSWLGNYSGATTIYSFAPADPGTADIASIVPRVRFKQGDTPASPNIVQAAIGKLINGAPAQWGPGPWNTLSVTPNTITTVDGAILAALDPAGGLWDKNKTYAIMVVDGHAYTNANRAYVYEVAAVQYQAAKPVASVAVSPGTTVTTTSYPSFTPSVQALIESWQSVEYQDGNPATRHCPIELKIFDAATYGAGGFDPAVATPVFSATTRVSPAYIDGVTLTTLAATAIPSTVLLPNGNYRAYTRAKRGFSGATWGAWAYTAFTMNITPPTAPTASATKDDTYQRVAITVTPQTSTGATNPLITVQRSSDGGLTYTDVRGATDVPGAFSTPATFYDYEAPRATTLTYRANVEATVATQQLVSTWATAAVTGTISAAEWNIKVPGGPAMNMCGVSVLKDPDYTQVEDTAVFRPRGRTFPVVVSMGLGGADGSLTIDTGTSDEWAALQAILGYRGTLYLESPFGWARYVRVLGRSWQEYGSASATRRRVKLDFLQAAMP